MLTKKVLVGILATLFCLLIAGVAVAENEYEDVFSSHNATMSSTSMDSHQDMNAKSGGATTDQKQQADHPNSRPLLCAASFQDNGELPKNHQDYCRNLYGS